MLVIVGRVAATRKVAVTFPFIHRLVALSVKPKVRVCSEADNLYPEPGNGRGLGSNLTLQGPLGDSGYLFFFRCLVRNSRFR